MEINQLVLFLLLALHFAPKDSHTIAIQEGKKSPVTYTQQEGYFWTTEDVKGIEEGPFKIRKHNLYHKMEGKESVILSLADLMGDDIETTDFATATKIKLMGLNIKIKRKKQGVDFQLEQYVTGEKNSVVKVRWK